MKCPKCGKNMKVTHRYSAGPRAGTQRLQCTDTTCDVVATCTVIMKNVDPGYGEGAAALAKKLLTEIPD